MKKIKTIFKIILDILVYFLIIMLSLYLCLTLYQKFINKDELLSFNNYYIFQIASSSMETNLHIGDYVIIEKTKDYRVGDVITFKEDGVYITHRIHEIKGDSIITKGDANSTVDESIDKNDVLGKLLFKASIFSFVIKYKFAIIMLLISLLIIESILKKEDMKKDK